MRETGLIFGGPMVRAIQEDRKSQTRRLKRSERCPYGKMGDRLWVKEVYRIDGWTEDAARCTVTYQADMTTVVLDVGAADSDVWSQREERLLRQHGAVDDPEREGFIKMPEGRDVPWRNPMFMPRWLSRFDLEITEPPRVERICDISDMDALREGVEPSPRLSPRERFEIGWERIHGEGAWKRQKNDLVWVISFKRIA